MAALSASSFYGLVCKGFSSYQCTWFHVSTLDGNIGQKMHWHKEFAAISELCSKWTVTDWKVWTALCVHGGWGVFILFHRLFCKGKGEMYTFYSSNILSIMFISCDKYAKRYATHWAESEPLVNVECGRCSVLGCSEDRRGEAEAHHGPTVVSS